MQKELQLNEKAARVAEVFMLGYVKEQTPALAKAFDSLASLLGGYCRVARDLREHATHFRVNAVLSCSTDIERMYALIPGQPAQEQMAA